MKLYVAPSGIDSALTARVANLEGKNVRSTRFATISSGTSGTVTLPSNSTVVLDDFGGTVDALTAQMSGGKPTNISAVTSTGVTIATTFDSSGNYVLSGTPSAYPVAIVYRVLQTLANYDSSSTDIIGDSEVYGSMAIQNSNAVAITGGTVNGTTIGATTPSTAILTTAKIGTASVLTSTGTLLVGSAGAQTLEVQGTLTTNARAAFTFSSNFGGTRTSNFEFGTDLATTGIKNFYIYNYSTNSAALTIGALNDFSMVVSGQSGLAALLLSGSPYTAGTATTNKPLQLIEPVGATSTGWSTAGTLFGVNSKSGFSGNLIDTQNNGVSQFKVDINGSVTTTGTFLTPSRSVSIATTLTTTDFLVKVTAAVTITLPASPAVGGISSASGQTLNIKNISGSSISVAGNGKTIDGAASFSLPNGSNLSLVYVAASTDWTVM